VWHTPQAWMATTASPGPGSGTTIVSIDTGSPLVRAITPRTVWLMTIDRSAGVFVWNQRGVSDVP